MDNRLETNPVSYVTGAVVFTVLICFLAKIPVIADEVKNGISAKSTCTFRIDTDIYSDPKKAPIKHTLTLFTESVYYDFEDGDSGRVTVIDPGRSRIILLDRRRQVKSEVMTEEILRTIDNARVQADAKLSTVTLKDFQKSSNGETVAVVSNDSIEYRSTLYAPTVPDMASQYAEFANWSARLNSVYAPMPPYLRLDLNELIASRDMLPKELTRTSRKGIRQSQLICRLRVNDRLSEDDRSRIARVGAMMAEFSTVPIKDYWNEPVVIQASAAESRKD